MPRAPGKFDAVLTLWAKGLTQSQIAERVGMTVGSVAVYVSRGRHRGDARAVDRGYSTKIHDHEEIIRLRAGGMTYRAISKATGVPFGTVSRILCRSAERGDRVKSYAIPVPIPKWVPASLYEDFLDVARDQGEEAAASHVRRLKAEAARADA